MSNYKITKTFEDRQNESKEIIDKYPNRIPLIIEKLVNKNDSIIPDIDKNKYLVPDDLTASQLMYVIRKRLKLKTHYYRNNRSIWCRKKQNLLKRMRLQKNR